jgi:hypothetical protein
MRLAQVQGEQNGVFDGVPVIPGTAAAFGESLARPGGPPLIWNLRVPRSSLFEGRGLCQRERQQPPITAAGDEVQVALSVPAFQPFGHWKSD